MRWVIGILDEDEKDEFGNHISGEVAECVRSELIDSVEGLAWSDFITTAWVLSRHSIKNKTIEDVAMKIIKTPRVFVFQKRHSMHLPRDGESWDQARVRAEKEALVETGKVASFAINSLSIPHKTSDIDNYIRALDSLVLKEEDPFLKHRYEPTKETLRIIKSTIKSDNVKRNHNNAR